MNLFRHSKNMLFAASFFLSIASLEPHDALAIGLKVWQNECAGTVKGLVFWNEKEAFISLGIGHFIWYPEHRHGPFAETFPELVRFLQSRRITIPQWILGAKSCPWNNRDAFQKDLQSNTKRIRELRRLLQETITEQAQFLQIRFEQALPHLLTYAGPKKKERIERQYRRVAECPGGHFALLDYVNFKGYGTLPDETYDGLGWGLYQVLDNMPDSFKGSALIQFVASAKVILQRRVEHAPQKNEDSFLNGWLSRLDHYKP